MPQVAYTFAPATLEISAFFADEARRMGIRLGPNLTLAAGTILAQNSTDNKFYAYANGGANGTGTARAVLKHAVVTDANGNATLGTQTPGEWGQVTASVECFISGTFRKGDLGGNLDATAIASLGARYITGSTTAADDLLRIP